MNNGAYEITEDSPKRGFIASLSFALFATGKLDIIASLFLVEIAATFLASTDKTAIGTASQIIAISSAIAVIFGLLNGILSVRIKHKSLLLFGSFCIILGTIGCFLAPNFTYLLIFYPLDGVGSIIVSAMSIALIGDFLPLEKRAKAIGWVIAGPFLATGIGFPLAGIIESIGGWRSYLLWYILPVSILALALAFFFIPNTKKQKIYADKKAYLIAFKEVLLTKSATACLVGNSFLSAANVWSLFAPSFWRQQFLISIQTVAVIVVLVILFYATGCIIGGSLVNRIGRKSFTVITWSLRGVLIAAIVLMPDFWTALGISLLATIIAGFALTAGNSLSLEQVPKSRGMMMSMHRVFWALGATIGASLGGVILGQFGYQILGVAFGFFSIAAAFTIFLLAKDPAKN